MYNCIACNFETKYLGDFRKHLKFKPHRNTCTSKNVCHICLKQFKSKSWHSTHVKKCKVVLYPITHRVKEKPVEHSFETYFEHAILATQLLPLDHFFPLHDGNR
jgi:hypothetical protein